jgi:hypothetical protein
LKPRLAFQRVCDELLDQPKSGRAFVVNQLEVQLIELDYDGWIKALAATLKNDQYAPGPIECCNAPNVARP